jgi:hypothetical protein
VHCFMENTSYVSLHSLSIFPYPSWYIKVHHPSEKLVPLTLRNVCLMNGKCKLVSCWSAKLRRWHLTHYWTGCFLTVKKGTYLHISRHLFYRDTISCIILPQEWCTVLSKGKLHAPTQQKIFWFNSGTSFCTNSIYNVRFVVLTVRVVRLKSAGRYAV